MATNIFELRHVIGGTQGRICAYDLEGTILAADCSSGTLFLRDRSGTTALDVNLRGLELHAGQRIRLRGTNFAANADIGLSLGTSPVVDANNLHSTIERSAEVYLKAGRHPIRVLWFNRTGTYFLEVSYSGPKIAKQIIPASALVQDEIRSGDKSNPGLLYRCYEGEWDMLPDFGSLAPRKTGIVSTFDISVKTREENVGLDFRGFIEIPDSGNYKFYLSSDDGAQLFLDDTPPNISILGPEQVPTPELISIGQPLAGGQDDLWAEVEGTITFMSSYKGHVKLELASSEKRMQAEVLNPTSEVPWYLLNSRVRLRGVCPYIKSAAGQKYAAEIAVDNWRDLRVLDVAPGQWSSFRNTTLGELKRRSPAESGGMACLYGRLHFDRPTQTLQFEDSTASAPIELLSGLAIDTNSNSDVDCLTRWSWHGTNLFLGEAVTRESFKEAGGKTNAPRVLRTAMQVQQLTRAEAAREYTAEIQGVVTWVSGNFKSLLIQDDTRAVFVLVEDGTLSHFPNVGDYCKIRGVCRPADFSPIVVLRDLTILWKGEVPQPLNPTRDQLLSGSLDAQYVEIRGLVIGTHDAQLTLLTSDGVLEAVVSPEPAETWNAYLNSIIRVRGCLFASWDASTHRVILDQPIQIETATVSIDSSPPSDLFEADKVRAKDLMQFDVRFDTFRRVKVHGQIIHGNYDEYYLMDDSTGLRFRLAQPLPFYPGDEVEVVGLVEPGGVSPVLRQAIARKIGRQPLPEPRQLSMNSISNSYDSTLVSVEGILVGFRNYGAERDLEMQVGVKNFLARLDPKPTPAIWTIGSRLRLTGTFRALDGERSASQEVNSFELLLNSPKDITVMALPPWWTFSRLRVVVSCLLAGLALAFVWITLLRRQVERRTQQLGREIGERERAEKLRAIEHERSRIARDLHDDLGSTLTEISMMATVSPGQKIGSETAANRLQEIAEKSRSMVSALDGVVWVVNSKNDTISSLVEYLASYAEEFLGKAQIACRVELPEGYAERIISADIRHDVMLAVREVFNNAVRHGRPSEVLLRVIITRDNLEILIHDNGGGFDPVQVKGNGLDNLQQRMHKLNGSCQVESSPLGTSITLNLPLLK